MSDSRATIQGLPVSFTNGFHDGDLPDDDRRVSLEKLSRDVDEALDQQPAITPHVDGPVVPGYPAAGYAPEYPTTEYATTEYAAAEYATTGVRG